MGFAALTAVWFYSQAPDFGSLLVLVALADWCNEDGYCWPSRRTIANRTGASEATVKRVLRDHIKRGELERILGGHVQPGPREFVGATGFHPTNLYRVTLVDRLGTKRPAPETLARNQARGLIVSPVPNERGLIVTPERGVADAGKGGSPARSSLCTEPSEDPPVEPSVLQAAQAGLPPATRAVENPADNLSIITKLAHEVLDLLEHTPDVEVGEVMESVKRRCALYHIAYDSGVVSTAINSACFQRQRIGKPAVLPGSAGEAAAKLQRLPRTGYVDDDTGRWHRFEDA